jgi:hypothetical protein
LRCALAVSAVSLQTLQMVQVKEGASATGDGVHGRGVWWLAMSNFMIEISKKISEAAPDCAVPWRCWAAQVQVKEGGSATGDAV